MRVADEVFALFREMVAVTRVATPEPASRGCSEQKSCTDGLLRSPIANRCKALSSAVVRYRDLIDYRRAMRLRSGARDAPQAGAVRHSFDLLEEENT